MLRKNIKIGHMFSIGFCGVLVLLAGIAILTLFGYSKIDRLNRTVERHNHTLAVLLEKENNNPKCFTALKETKNANELITKYIDSSMTLTIIASVIAVILGLVTMLVINRSSIKPLNNFIKDLRTGAMDLSSISGQNN